ncbi:sigma 54-interacting transcriptional regulator [Pectinatus haikarae]|uniref:Transcriptional regulator with AAA-type ATPase domain/transcriptional regulatory protein LevR n=1 Tax=Pectinatus haikarae TaxID=349096 RepID=A0ABT9Y842_9FIRM|nr:sigma 54-interacting transcriptional regulator [Pectinatus haikarae]MDQ0203701.1 transcriptional regulator with AAA-type ATPase domain/transcriptional regulatory protein LevR [Pectinatus haikarae]
MTDNLRDKLAAMINTENKKNPLTDEQLAEQLDVLRETVTGIRKELDIPNSRTRKKEIVKAAVSKIKEKDPDISIGNLVSGLEKEGICISRTYINDLMNEEKNGSVEEQDNSEKKKENDIFSKLIGYNGSLLKNIKQGQAAILYPPFGLPTLIIGESGTGKTLFAEYMYKYAVKQKVLKNDAPFILLNCADYSDNPQLLVSILYGYQKGAFTGADKDTEGLVEKADNGMLFLDEIHRLPPKGQEMLFSILDRGKFRRLGDINTERTVHIYFIGATTENIESSLLLTFRRRIPMLIELPRLEDRSLNEKVKLIHGFFQQEANRTNYKILVNAKIMEAFAFKKYSGNIGQLKSEIQVTCANAYVDKINNKREEIYIGFNEILYQKFFYDIDTQKNNMRFNDALFIPNSDEAEDSLLMVKNQYSLPEDIYETIENKYYELKNASISADKTEEIIWNFLLSYFDKIRLDAQNRNISSLDELKYLLDGSIIQLLKEFVTLMRADRPERQINEKVLIYLAIHLEEAVKRIKFKQEIMNPNLLYIKANFADEFKLAGQLAQKLSEKKKIEIPEGEIGFIAIYIHELMKPPAKKNRIAIITISHGKVATEMVSVVKKMLSVDFPIAIDMPLDINPVKIFEQVVELAKSLSAEEGILFFVDMGSLVSIGEIVHSRTGMQTRTIDRVDLVSVLEAVRKADASDESLDNIYYDIINSKHNYSLVTVENSDKPPALICMCLTGHGVALKIKDILIKYYVGVKIIPLSIMDDNVKAKIDNLRQQYNLLAIVGTINPKIEGLNFIPYDNNFTKDKRMFLDYLLKENGGGIAHTMIREELVLVGLECADKKEVIETMGKLLCNEGFVKFEYINSVLGREDMNSTYFRNCVALPHGLPSFVNKSVIIFARLKKAIPWDKNGNEAQLICMPAVKSEDVAAINNLFKILKQKEKVEKLISAQQQTEFVEIIRSAYE